MIKYRIEWILPTGGTSVGEAVYDTREDAMRMAEAWKHQGAGEYRIVPAEHTESRGPERAS